MSIPTLRQSIAFAFLMNISISHAQEKLSTKNDGDTISFITTIDISKASKGGFYLNGYIVDIDYYEAKKITGKKIRVSGIVTLVKGLKNDPEYKKGIQKAGWLNDTKHIYNPKIEVLK